MCGALGIFGFGWCGCGVGMWKCILFLVDKERRLFCLGGHFNPIPQCTWFEVPVYSPSLEAEFVRKYGCTAIQSNPNLQIVYFVLLSWGNKIKWGIAVPVCVCVCVCHFVRIFVTNEMNRLIITCAWNKHIIG